MNNVTGLYCSPSSFLERLCGLFNFENSQGSITSLSNKVVGITLQSNRACYKCIGEYFTIRTNHRSGVFVMIISFDQGVILDLNKDEEYTSARREGLSCTRLGGIGCSVVCMGRNKTFVMTIRYDIPEQTPGRYAISTPAVDVVRWMREEMSSPFGTFEFNERAWKAYCHNTEFDRTLYGIDKNDEDPPILGDVPTLISVEAGLDVEPHREQDYWILEVRVLYDIGIRPYSKESMYMSDSLTLDEFEEQFIKPDRGKIDVHVEAHTVDARKHFEDWVSLMRQRHKR